VSMAVTTIRPMTVADLPSGLALSRQAGWNQIESDWRRFLDLEPGGCFVAELDGAPVGTTTTCIFGPVAWIAMVLVDVAARRQGVGSALLRHALEFLDKQGVKTVRLDATAAGQHVYEKLGFVPEYPLARYEGVVSRTGTSCDAAPVTEGLIPELAAFDHRMAGTPRAKLLTRLFQESPEAMRALCKGDEVEGYATLRPGANAMQIGPCVATPEVGAALLGDALDRCAGWQVFVDVPCDNASAVRLLESAGLTVQRSFTRMYRGESVSDNVNALWAGSGPEKG
jgi:ribosomal protein S18 acetylase RimI-like enzyme